MRTDARGWAAEAERGQEALDERFVSRFGPLPWLGDGGRMRNTSPWRLRQAFDFNYWWLAHAVEVRVDAFERSGDGHRLDQARAVYQRILKRNRGLFNDYFDDMGWLCLAALRLADATGERRYLRDAQALWERIATEGWNPAHGPSVSWRVQQPGYKNAPSNGAFALASLRLHARTGELRFLDRGEAALDWMRTRLLDERALVLDGIGRTGGDEIDRDWIFSYNQGLLIGTLCERFDRSGETALLHEAARTAAASILLLARDDVITGESARLDERGGGDAGLFKGIFFRHLEGLLERIPDAEAGSDAASLVTFFLEATDRLRLHLHPSETAARPSRTARPHLAGDDWSRPAPRTTALATELSAVLTLEARARWDARSGAVAAPGSIDPTV